MLVYVTLSPRRFLLLDVPQQPTSWQFAQGAPNLGFLSARATRIAGPADWSTILEAASAHAKEHRQLVSNEEWNKQLAARLPL